MPSALFDGQYAGGSPRSGETNGCGATIAAVTITDGKISGTYKERNYTFNVSGTAAPDGKVTGKWCNNRSIGNFTGTHFAGTYNSKECGPGTIALDKTD